MPGERGNVRTLPAAWRNAESCAPDSSVATASSAASTAASSIMASSAAVGSANSSASKASSAASSSNDGLSNVSMPAFYPGRHEWRTKMRPLAWSIDVTPQVRLDLVQPLVHLLPGFIQQVQLLRG